MKSVWIDARGDSYRSEPPYANLNHIGMAYATYSVTDLDRYFATLQAKGVEFVSAPPGARVADHAPASDDIAPCAR